MIKATIMKSIRIGYIFTIMPLLTFAACTADDSSDASVDTPIRYSVSMQSPSRGVISGTTLPEDETFLLHAVKNREGDAESTIIDADVVSCKDHVWQTSSTYYWPFNSYTVSFYAVCPTDAPFDKTNKTLSYTPASPVIGSDDVMLAYSMSSREEASTVGYAAELSFNHVMTQVKFWGYKRNADWTVIIKNITLCNINSTGTYSLDKGSWSGVSSLKEYSLSMSGNLALTSTDKDTPHTLTTDDGMLMLIPQTLAAWDGSEIASQTNKSFLRIECRIIDGNGINLVGNDSSFGLAYLPLPGDWLAGNVCRYVLGFGAGFDENGEQQATVYIHISNTDIDSFDGNSEPDFEGEAECITDIMDAAGNIIACNDGGTIANGDGYNPDYSTLPIVNGSGTITDYNNAGSSSCGDGYNQGGNAATGNGSGTNSNPAMDGSGDITGYGNGGYSTSGKGYNQDGSNPTANSSGTITGYGNGGYSASGGAYTSD